MILNLSKTVVDLALDVAASLRSVLEVRPLRPLSKSYLYLPAAALKAGSRFEPHSVAPMLWLLGLLALVLPMGSASAAAPTLSNKVIIAIEGQAENESGAFNLKGSNLDNATVVETDDFMQVRVSNTETSTSESLWVDLEIDGSGDDRDQDCPEWDSCPTVVTVATTEGSDTFTIYRVDTDWTPTIDFSVNWTMGQTTATATLVEGGTMNPPFSSGLWDGLWYIVLQRVPTGDDGYESNPAACVSPSRPPGCVFGSPFGLSPVTESVSFERLDAGTSYRTQEFLQLRFHFTENNPPPTAYEPMRGAESQVVQTEALQPETEGDGTPMDPTPGDSEALVDGQPVAVTTEVVTNEVVLTAGPVSMAVGATNGSESVTPTSDGLLTVTPDATVEVTGSGFEPGSDVAVWVFSSPTLLGTTTVGSDGSFSEVFSLPSDIAEGEHSVQADGVTSDGSTRSLSLGIQIVADAGSPASSPTAIPTAPWLVLLFTAIGLAILGLRGGLCRS